MQKKNYLITGASGVIGSAIIPFLIQDPDSQASILLRADNRDHLRSKFESLKAYWSLPASLASKIEAFQGDVEKKDLGLSAEDYQALLSKTTHIIHAAGNVKMNLPLDQARSSAVGSAKNMMAFAKECLERKNLQKIEFISTVGVGGLTPGLIPETWMPEQTEFHNTYEQSKAEAEFFIKKEIEQGMPITIHRPSMVVGDSHSGKIPHFQIFYHLCRFLTGNRTKGVMPFLGSTSLDIIPSDYVAKAILWSSNQKSTNGLILHLASGASALRLEQLRGAVHRYWASKGENIPRTLEFPPFVFKLVLPLIALFVPKQIKKSLKTLPLFLSYLGSNQRFDTSKTEKLLVQAGLRIPEPGDYLDNLFDYYFGHARKIQKDA